MSSPSRIYREFLYDDAGQLVCTEDKNSGTSTYVVDPNAALSRTLVRTKNGVTTYYVYGHGLLYEETSGAIKAYHYDHLGSTVLITNASGQITDRVGYGIFGGLAERTGSTDTPFLFHGEHGVMTDANGLCYMRARYYNPRLMRFVNADPIGFDGGLNWYAFVGNNPLGGIDPSGLCRTGTGGGDPNSEAVPNANDTLLGQLIRFIAMVGGQTADNALNTATISALGAQEGLRDYVGISGDFALNILPVPRAKQYGPFPAGVGWGVSVDANFKDGINGNQQLTVGKFGAAGSLGITFTIPFYGSGSGGNPVSEIVFSGGAGPGGALRFGVDGNGNLTDVKITIGVGYGFEASGSVPFPKK